MNKFIFGKNDLENIVSIDKVGEELYIYREDDLGVSVTKKPYRYWFLSATDHDTQTRQRLKGDLFYQYVYTGKSQEFYDSEISTARSKGEDLFVIKNHSERAMVRQGFTCYKGLKVADVSVLSFDIETTGIAHNRNSKVLVISNTYRHQSRVVRKVFSVDDYKSDKEMINEWTKWVRRMDPSIITGHNIFGFDLPYLKYRAGSLELGRDGSKAYFYPYKNKFRRDGSQFYDYTNVQITGRQLVDTFFLSIKADVARQYSSYALKTLIQESGIQKDNRQFYEAKNIGAAWKDVEERKKIIQYAQDDADDSLALYELFVPAYFYICQSLPMTLQNVINRGTGAQINAFMSRSYLQEGHSIPAPSDSEAYPGGISFGNPGIYNNVYKVDVASLYPSIIRQYNVYDEDKDPKRHFLSMVNYFTDERLENKRLAKETGDEYYKGLEQAQKIMINSAYGFMGAGKLNFNSPQNAAKVTKIGREILQKGIDYAESKELFIVNADTDSFSFNNFSGEFDTFIEELNKQFDNGIIWENDGYYDSVLVVKAKNYALKTGDKVKIKGSALKATMKEPALREFNERIIARLLNGTNDLTSVYNDYASEISGIEDIYRWASKKTVTESVLKPKRTNEQRILDAINGRRVQEGDKIKVFFERTDKLSMVEDFNGEYDKDKLYEKLFKTVKVFEPVLDIEQFPNYKLKKNVEKRP